MSVQLSSAVNSASQVNLNATTPTKTPSPEEQAFADALKAYEQALANAVANPNDPSAQAALVQAADNMNSAATALETAAAGTGPDAADDKAFLAEFLTVTGGTADSNYILSTAKQIATSGNPTAAAGLVAYDAGNDFSSEEAYKTAITEGGPVFQNWLNANYNM